jgi:hypothetical protein
MCISSYAMANGALIECAVTSDHLYARASAAGMNDQSARDLFVLFRANIEKLALKKYQAGSDRPLVVTSDLQPGDLRGSLDRG